MSIVALILGGCATIALFHRTQTLVINESGRQRATWRHDVGTCVVFAAYLAALLWSQPRLSLATALTLGVGSGTMAVQSTIDRAIRRLPLAISYSSTAIMLFIILSLNNSTARALAICTGGAAMLSTAKFMAIISRGSLGRGDVYFCLPLGVVLDVDSTPSATLKLVMFAWNITAVAGGTAAMIGVLFHRIHLRSTIACGPFLATGTIMTLALHHAK